MTENMRSFVEGIAMALCSPPRAFPKREPVAFLYNGVRLLKALEHDNETHPYEVIGYCDVHGYVFTYSSQPWTTNEDGEIWPSRLLAYHLSDDGTAWVSNAGVVNYITPIWANHDILNEDGTVCLAASDPVPVYE